MQLYTHSLFISSKHEKGGVFCSTFPHVESYIWLGELFPPVRLYVIRNLGKAEFLNCIKMFSMLRFPDGENQKGGEGDSALLIPCIYFNPFSNIWRSLVRIYIAFEISFLLPSIWIEKRLTLESSTEGKCANPGSFRLLFAHAFQLRNILSIANGSIRVFHMCQQS